MSCPDCVVGGLLPGEPTGIRSIRNAYFSASPSANNPSKRAVLLLTDVFGLSYKNPMILADMIAKRLDCDVWVPDYFNGEAIFKLSVMEVPGVAGQKKSWTHWLKFYLTIIVPRLHVYYRNRPSVTDVRLREFIAELQSEKKYEKIGAVGYCYGGVSCVRIASTGLVDSVVICHPAAMGFREVKAMKVPSLWVCAEEDYLFDKIRDQVRTILEGKKDNTHEMVIHKGTTHGFACRPDLTHPEIKEAFERSIDQTVSWFAKTW